MTGTGLVGGRSGADPVYDVIVVGAGIAGLAAAWQLRSRRILVLEAAERVGGRIRSEARGPYWINLGPHLFPDPTAPLGRLVSEVGLETVPVRGRSMGAFLNGKLVAAGPIWTYPLQLPTSWSTRAALIRAGKRIYGAVGEYVRLGQVGSGEDPSMARFRLLSYRDDQTFSEFIGTVPPDAAALIRAAVNRVSAEPEELAAGAGAAQFATTFHGGGSSVHRNLIGGASRLSDELARRLSGRILTNAAATQVRNGASGVEVHYTHLGEERIAFGRTAIVATPAPIARHVIADLPPGLAEALGAIAYGPYVVAGMITRETRPMPWDGLYAVVVAKRSFNMFFNVASVLRERGGVRRPGGSLMVYGASNLARALQGKPDEEVKEVFLHDLDEVFPGSRACVEEIVIQRWDAGIPFSRPGRHRGQPWLEKPVGNIFLAGDYVAARGGMDTAVAVAFEAAQKALDRLTRLLGGSAA